jgi:hypothetical protein
MTPEELAEYGTRSHIAAGVRNDYHWHRLYARDVPVLAAAVEDAWADNERLRDVMGGLLTSIADHKGRLGFEDCDWSNVRDAQILLRRNNPR